MIKKYKSRFHMHSLLRPQAFLTLVLFMTSFGCTKISNLIASDSGLRADDAGFNEDPFPCDPENLDTDFHNCGACDLDCPSNTSDNCAGGVCMCGAGAACAGGEECRFGVCLAPDLTGRTCEFDDECVVGYACIGDHCTFVRCESEACDGFDNDCDGVVDENSDSTGPLSRWCLTGGDPANVTPPCQRGNQICDTNGEWSGCEGEIAPTPELGLLACDDVDNDCDGCVDGVVQPDGACVEQGFDGFDIVFVVDLSGSMRSLNTSVLNTMEAFASVFSLNPEFRFGIVTTPVLDEDLRMEEDFRAGVFVDLTNYESFITKMRELQNVVLGSHEATRDAVYELGTGSIPMDWRPDSIRMIVMFTDEEAQSYRDRRGLMNLDSDIAMCSGLTHGEYLAVFTPPSHAGDWNHCAEVFLLGSDPAGLTLQLDSVITDPCAR